MSMMSPSIPRLRAWIWQRGLHPWQKCRKTENARRERSRGGGKRELELSARLGKRRSDNSALVPMPRCVSRYPAARAREGTRGRATGGAG